MICFVLYKIPMIDIEKVKICKKKKRSVLKLDFFVNHLK